MSTIAEIIEAVASVHGISARDITGTARTQDFVRPRQQAMYLARERTGCSLPQIARAFHRDHTTVMHGIGRHKARADRADADAAVLALLAPLFRRRPDFISTRTAP